MGRPNAYTTMQRARALRARHPDASPSHVAIAVVMASFADGPTGTSIRPGLDRVAELTGLHRETVKRAIRWLEARGELRRDRQGHRGSAACFSWIGGKQMPQASPIDGKGMPDVPEGDASGITHHSHRSNPTGLPGPRAGALMECSVCGKRANLTDGLCPRCLAAWQSGDPEAIERLTR
jgi:hypothetical protein